MASCPRVRKDIKDILEGAVVPGARGKRKGVAKVAEESGRYENELRSPSEISKRIRQLEEKMYQLARDLSSRRRRNCATRSRRCASAWSTSEPQ